MNTRPTTRHSDRERIRAAKLAKLQTLLGRPLSADEAEQLRMLAADLGVNLRWQTCDLNNDPGVWRDSG